MKRPSLSFVLLLWVPGGILLGFILLPLLQMVATQTPQTLGTVAADAEVRDALWLSLETAAITAVIAAILGTPYAYILAHSRGKTKAILSSLIDLPLAVPHTVAGIALLFVFGRQGILGVAGSHIGLSFWGTKAAIVIAMLFVSVPFMVNAARLGFESVSPRLEQMARTLGATPFEVMYRITLPLAVRGILSGMVLTYARSISEIGAVMVLAYYPMTAPIKIFDLYLQTGLRLSSAMAVLLLLISLSSFFVLRYLSGEVGKHT